MSHISKCRGADSSPAGNSECPQAGTFIPASKSDENRIVGTSSVAGNKLFQQNCKPSAQMQSQITPQVSKPLRRARKFFQNSNNNNQIAFLAEKDLAGNLETTVPLSRNSIKVEPVANADLTSPITRKGAICQESYPTFTPQQLEQSHRKTKENDTEMKILASVKTKTSGSEETKPTIKQKLMLAQQNQSGEKATSSEKNMGTFAEHFQPPIPPQIEDPNVETRMAALRGDPLEIAQEVIDDVSVNSNGSDATTVPLSDFESTPKNAGRLIVKKSTSKARVPSEVDKLLQDEGAARIMQEMKGKGTKKDARQRAISFMENKRDFLFL